VPVSAKRVMAACAMAMTVAVTGCGSQLPTVKSIQTQPAPAPAASTRWPERPILPEDTRLWSASQVLDPAADVLYALVSTTLTSQYGPYVLEAINLRTGRVRRGASYPVSGLALAAGYLWVYGTSGPGGHALLDEDSPRTLTTLRSAPMPAPAQDLALAPGPAGSVWVGRGRTLLRISASTGAVLARATLPAVLDLTDLALGPGAMTLYASAARLPPGGAVVLAYSAATGMLTGQADRAPLTFSVGGAELTPVPGGVWVSFRTGMLGRSVLLSSTSLSVINGFPTGTSRAASPVTGPGTIGSWPMSESALYAAGALWVATGGGLLACVNPRTGQVRAEETTRSQATILLAADRAANTVFAVTGDAGIAAISPPPICWT
jgi:hypothetical protein